MNKPQLPDLQSRQLQLQALEWLKARGMTQGELAAAMNASQSQVSKALAGSTGGAQMLVRICDFIGLSLNKKEARWSPILAEALDRVWDGSDEQALVIASLLLAAEHVGRH